MYSFHVLMQSLSLSVPANVKHNLKNIIIMRNNLDCCNKRNECKSNDFGLAEEDVLL